jgi:tRNA-2-methylthio-N6-dimethylallyladenosine synthase
VLDAMQRLYNREQYLERIAWMKSAKREISITTDVIVGFPGETEADFAETLSLLDEVGYDGVFSFKYSARPGTASSQVSESMRITEDVKSARLDEILRLQDQITCEKNAALAGRVVEVLVEGPSEKNPDLLTGRTRTNKVVNFSGSADLKGKFQMVTVTKTGRHSLTGVPV